MSILYGFYKADAGEIIINGQLTAIPDSQSAIRAGIGMVFQHFKLVQNFTVLENVILGAEDGALLQSSLVRARAELEALSKEYDLDVHPDAVIEDLSVGHQQRVEILKALYRQADILILDEPTGVLTPEEADHLFRILAGLKEKGRTIILITHKLREIMETTDNVSVMRRGTMVDTVRTAETSPEALAELMVGRKVLLEVEKRPATPGREVLRVENLTVRTDGVDRLKGVSFTIRAGEILGIAGVAGNGQSQLLEALGGIAAASGRITMNGVELPLKGHKANGQSRRTAGIAHVPEDRQTLGLIMDFAAWENVGFGYHNAPEYQRNWLFMDNAALKADTVKKMATFDVRPPIPTLAAKSFSGGNQQKIVVAREIERNPDLLLVGQPTRGVDIGAIEFIHKQIVALRDAGKAVLLVSVELDEIMSLSDRILVMFDGKIMGERDPDTTNERELGLLMAGMTESKGA
jgi:simple sugar transport system ATP-binding protein